MLESRPPDRKLDTGTSDTRWAATDSSIAEPRSAGGPAAPLRGDVWALPVVLHREGTVWAEQCPRTAGKLLHAVDGAPLLRQPVIEHRRHQSTGLDPQLRAHRSHERLQLRGEH